jgi:sulfur-oxidizing protein SoxY
MMNRRDLCLMGAAGFAALALSGVRAHAATDKTADAIKAFTGGVEPSEGGVTLTTPEIAENGNTVPVEVEAAGAARIIVLASGNPNPGVAIFEFGPLAGAQRASTRIRLAKTQNVVAVAEMPDGSFRMAIREVKVTIGGCGG